MICKEGSIDVISIGKSSGGNTSNNSANSQQMHHGGAATITNGHHTLQHRRKSQLITFSASSCDIKNSLSHEIIMINSNSNVTANGINGQHSGANNGRGSFVGSIGSSNTQLHTNTRLSFAEEDIMIIPQNGPLQQQQQQKQQPHNQQRQKNGSLTGSGTGSGSGSESVGGHNNDLEDEVFRRHSMEVDEEAQEALFNEEYGTHIETKSNNANDDSGGGSYEDSHALHSSLGGSNRNSLEKDDDDIDVDVISTDVSCYEQLLGSSCNTRNDDDENATIVGDGENYTKLSKHALKASLNGGGSYGVVNGSGGLGENGGIIYANPFMGL